MHQATYYAPSPSRWEELRPFPCNARRGDPAVILQSLVRTRQFRSLIARHTDSGDPVVLAATTPCKPSSPTAPAPAG